MHKLAPKDEYLARKCVLDVCPKTVAYELKQCLVQPVMYPAVTVRRVDVAKAS